MDLCCPYLIKPRHSFESFQADVKRNIHLPYPDLIKNTTGFDTVIITNHKAGAYCNPWKKEIGARPDSVDLDVVLHEMAHAWQSMCGVDFWKEKTLSRAVEIEHEAEAVAKQIQLNILGVYLDRRYWSYFTKSDIQWLADYYDGWAENDLTI